MEIVTGSTGQVHVTPIDDAVRNSNLGYLNDKVVMTCFRNFEASIITNNQVRVYSGYGVNQGRYFKIDDGEFDNVTIENGSQGYKRADLIVARYTMNTQTGFEDISLAVIRGTSGNDYVDPSYSTGDINGGDTSDDMPLYRVRINGLQIEGLDRLFTLLPDGGRIAELEALLSNALPVNHGGTGRTSIGNGKVLVGNASGRFDELGIDSTPSGSSNNLITSKGVAEALGRAGYGDMVKAVYDPNEDGIIAIGQGGTGANTVAGARQALGLGNTAGALPVANGGTGSQDGTLNGVKLATNGSQKGYINSSNNFVPFQSYTKTLLWENPNPYNPFGAQTINLDLRAYNYIEIESEYEGRRVVDIKKFKVDKYGYISLPFYESNNATFYSHSRKIIVDTDKIIFYDGARFDYQAAHGIEMTVPANYEGIPVRIYGLIM